ncbi:hypothetical protein EJD97_003176, partial [Solanum chilense]
GRSKSVAPSAHLVIGSDDEHDPVYVPPRTSTPSRVARAARVTSKKVASGVVTASQFDAERTLTGTPTGSATHKEGASGSLGVSWSEEASGSAEVPAPATAAQSTACDEADSSKSTPGSPTCALTPVVDQPTSGVSTGNHVRERGIQVDISLPAIPRYLYGHDVDANRTPLTAEFDYLWKIVKDRQLLRETSLRETTKRWIDLHFSFDGEGADWVTQPQRAIKKANLTSTSKFLWLIFRHYLSPTAADNIITWDHAILMAAMIARFEVHFAWLLQAVMHERAFKVTTTYHFPCMIFSLYRSASAPIWHIDQLKTPLGTVDIVLIRDKANELAPCRRPCQELPPLCDNMANTVAHALTAMQVASSDTTPGESIPGSSTAPISSCSAPFPALVPLASVKKLEAQMATLAHHIQPWMQRSIAEAEDRLE